MSLVVEHNATSQAARPFRFSTACGSPTVHLVGGDLAEAGPAFTRTLGPWYRYREPVQLSVERAVNGYVVSDAVTFRSGHGATRQEAMEDYADVVVEYLRTLRDNRDRLSPRLERHLRVLEDLIEGV